jgi:type IV pilus assembly protein PilC
MWFARRLSLHTLIPLCRMLRHSLDAGITLRDVFRQQAERGSVAVRPVAARISRRLEHGDSLEAALRQEEAAFPPLFIALVTVGEQSGRLPEVLKELEAYFTLQLQLSRQFRSQTLLPRIQFFFALIIIALLIYVLGVVYSSQNRQPPSLFGLRGTTGAFLFLGITFGTIFLAWLGYRALNAASQKKRFLDGLVLYLPALGPCVEAFALGRFALALQVTMESGMPIAQAVRYSLEATGNAAYTARVESVLDALEEGDELGVALARARVFAEDFLNMLVIAEQGGKVPEMMAHQAKYYAEEAGRRLTTLTRVCSFGVWLLYAVFMAFAIFTIAGVYFSALPKL